MHESYGLEDLFNTLITLEETGERLYTQFSQEITDVKVQEIFVHLANQERLHKIKYRSMRDTHEYELPDNEEYSQFIGTLIKSAFSLLKTENRGATKNEAILIGISLENDTLTFLDAVKKILGTIYKDDLEEIIAQEKIHLKLLQALR